MATTSVRKFALSVDPDEIVDFAEKLDYFAPIFKELDAPHNDWWTQERKLWPKQSTTASHRARKCS